MDNLITLEYRLSQISYEVLGSFPLLDLSVPLIRAWCFWEKNRKTLLLSSVKRVKTSGICQKKTKIDLSVQDGVKLKMMWQKQTSPFSFNWFNITMVEELCSEIILQKSLMVSFRGVWVAMK